MDHKEVRLLLNDYLSNILLHKPDDIFQFTKDHFQFLCTAPHIDRLLLIIGPKCGGRSTLMSRIKEEFPDQFDFPLVHWA